MQLASRTRGHHPTFGWLGQTDFPLLLVPCLESCTGARLSRWPGASPPRAFCVSPPAPRRSPSPPKATSASSSPPRVLVVPPAPAASA
eukprot:13939895-Alexandrium_andersonii.AAC.1